MGDWTRPLTEGERNLVLAARHKAFVLYEGRLTPHRSCGIALAETFGLPSRSYQSLRRGGLTGEGACGSVVAGRLVLGELLGDPDPTGTVTPGLRAAIGEYDARVHDRLGRPAGDALVCNALTEPHGDFRGAARASFCTRLATEMATLVAEVALRNDHPVVIGPIDGVPSFDPAAPVDPLPRAP